MGRKYIGSLIVRALSIASQFVLIAVIEQVVGGAGVGLYGSLFGFASVAAVAVSLGQSAAIMKEVPYRISISDYPVASITINRALLVTLSASIFFLLPIIALGNALIGSSGLGLTAFLMSVSLGFTETISASIRAFGFVVWSEATKNLLWRFFSVAALLTCGTLAFDVTAHQVVMVVIIATLTTTVASFALFLRRQRMALRLTSFSEIRRGFKVDAANWGLQTGQALMLNVDVIVVGATLGLESVAVYFVLTRLASIVALPMSITNPVIIPTLGRVAKEGITPKARVALRRNALINCGVSLLFGVVVLSSYQFTFPLLSSRETGAHEFVAFSLLVISQVINACVGPTSFASQLLNVRAKAAILLCVCLSGVTASLWIFSDLYGVVGAAGAVAVWRSVQNFGTFELIRRYGGLNLLTGSRH